MEKRTTPHQEMAAGSGTICGEKTISSTRNQVGAENGHIGCGAVVNALMNMRLLPLCLEIRNLRRFINNCAFAIGLPRNTRAIYHGYPIKGIQNKV
jgi:hypothetical protein